MSVRKMCAALGVTAVVATGLAGATLAPANADPSATPGATSYVGVGSDTIQFVMTDLINGATVNGQHVPGFNEQQSSGSPTMASWDACTVPTGKLYPCTPGSATDTSQYIKLRSTSTAAIPRPNGSGAGKKLLYGSTDNPDVTFARSSSGLSTTEVAGGLIAYPFAVDTLVTVTAPVTNAPANLTAQQILGIYTGKYTNWSQLGGKDGVINPLQPQSGSGTLSFFQSQLVTANGGTAPTYVGKDHELADSTGKPCATASATCVDTSVQEHDPTLITNDPNAIAPFSLGRANLAGPNAVSIIKGFSPRRAVYNVLRSKDAGNTLPDNPDWFAGKPAMNAIFGTDGFLCTAAARPIIEADGFKQLLNATDGGSCGSQVSSTSAPDLSVYDANGVASHVTAVPTSGKYGTTHAVKVAVTGPGGTPTGTVSLNVGGSTQTAPLTGGVATFAVSAYTKVGSYDAAVTYTGDANFQDSSTDAPFSVSKASSSASETFASTSRKGARTLAGKVAVKASPAVATSGTVTIKEGTKTIGAAKVSSGKASFKLTLSKLKKGKNSLKAVYSGSTTVAGTTKTFTITRK